MTPHATETQRSMHLAMVRERAREILERLMERPHEAGVFRREALDVLRRELDACLAYLSVRWMP